MKTIVITRHIAAVQWLAARGIMGEVLEHVDSPEQIRGYHVIGNLPLYLAAEAAQISAVEFPPLPAGKRGQDLTLTEMDEFGAFLATYVVRTVPNEVWTVEGAPSTFETYEAAEQWRSAQIWDGGVGMTPLPERFR